MILYSDSQAHPNPNDDDTILHVVQRGPPCLQLKGICHRTNALPPPPKVTSRRKTRRKPESAAPVNEYVLQDDNVVEYNQDTIEEFIVSYYKGRRRGRFQIWSYFRDMVRVPASIVPSLFIIIGIVVPIAVLAIVYVAPFPVTAITGIIFLFSLIRLNNRRVFEETIVIVPGFGISIQKRLQSGTLYHVDFIHEKSIEAVLIHEGFLHGRVVYFLAIAVKGRTELAIVFQYFLPRLEILKPVYKKLREHLPPK